MGYLRKKKALVGVEAGMIGGTKLIITYLLCARYCFTNFKSYKEEDIIHLPQGSYINTTNSV